VPFGSRCCCCCCSIERSRTVRPSSKVRLELRIPQVFRRSASSACLLAATAYKSRARAHASRKDTRSSAFGTRANSRDITGGGSSTTSPFTRAGTFQPICRNFFEFLRIHSWPPRLRGRQREKEREIASDRLNSYRHRRRQPPGKRRSQRARLFASPRPAGRSATDKRSLFLSLVPLPCYGDTSQISRE